jgi:excinuclease UvrABC nuclease subunit
MLQSAQNLEFERAAQLRDKINELKGTPIIHSGSAFSHTDEPQQTKIWQPKSASRGKRRVAK